MVDHQEDKDTARIGDGKASSIEQQALDAYWAATTPQEERQAIERMKALNMWAKDDYEKPEAPEALASTTDPMSHLIKLVIDSPWPLDRIAGVMVYDNKGNQRRAIIVTK